MFKSQNPILLILLFLFWVNHASAAVLYSQAANQNVFEGQTFVVDWFLDTENAAINTVSLKLDFSPKVLEIIDVSTGNSLLNLWIQNPTVDNVSGQVSLIGGITNGITSTKAAVIRTTFRAKARGPAYIKLAKDSKVLLNDGRGSASDLKYADESFNVYPADFAPVEISSETHPDQTAWYKSREVKIKFTSHPDTVYSYTFSSNIEMIPDEIAETDSEISYHNLPDGIYYFKLNSKKAAGSWQEAGVYRVQIDSTPPEPFMPIIASDPTLFAGRKFVSFATVDKTSGMLHYKVAFGRLSKPKNAQLSFVEIPKFFIGNQIKIIATDNAGNERVEAVKYDGFPEWLALAISLAILSLTAWVIRYSKYKIQKRT